MSVKIICDLCGQEIVAADGTIWRLKQRWKKWREKLPTRWVTIDAHESCIKAVAAAAMERASACHTKEGNCGENE